MEPVRQWVTGITCAAMIAAVLQAFFPKNGVGKAGRLAAGLLLLLAVAGPLAGLDCDSLSEGLAGLRAERTACAGELERGGGEMMKTLIERESAAYILDKAEELGIACRAEVACEFAGDGLPYPASARIAGELSAAEKKRLSEVLEGELGIPPQAQEFTEEVGEWTRTG